MLSSEVQGTHSQMLQLVRVRIRTPSLMLLTPALPHSKEQVVVSFLHPCHQMAEKGHRVSSSALTPSGLASPQQGELYCPLSDKVHGLLSCTQDLRASSPTLAPSSLNHQCPLPKVSALQCFLGKGQGPTLLGVAVGKRQSLLSLVP